MTEFKGQVDPDQRRLRELCELKPCASLKRFPPQSSPSHSVTQAGSAEGWRAVLSLPLSTTLASLSLHSLDRHTISSHRLFGKGTHSIRITLVITSAFNRQSTEPAFTWHGKSVA